MPAPELVSFAPDGRHVAIGSSRGHVLVLDIETGAALRAPQVVSEGLINGLAYSADSSLLVSSSFDGSVSLFDGETADLLGTVSIPSHQMTSADFQSDGHTVVIGSYDDGIYRWDTRLEGAMETACRMAGRDLTTQEWQETFGSRPYEQTCPDR
jgi:WD40 repeat protein